MSKLREWVEQSDDPLVKRQLESLVESARYVIGVLPSHVVNEEYPEPTWTTSGDDLDGLLWHADTVITLIDDHEFSGVTPGAMFCKICYTSEDNPAHRDADDMTTRGLL